jgi:hypothetical protein
MSPLRGETPNTNLTWLSANKIISCGDRNFVLKRVPNSIFEQSLELKQEFPATWRLRLHVDDDKAEQTLIYDYFSDNLLSLVKNNPSMSVASRKRILRELGLALNEFHARKSFMPGTGYK